MTESKDDPLDLNNLRVDPEMWPGKRAFTPRKIEKRRRQFIIMPWLWFEKLSGATDQTHRVGLYLLYLHWKGKGAPIKLPNGMLEEFDGITRWSKWRALKELERRELITVERRHGKSPIVRLNPTFLVL